MPRNPRTTNPPARRAGTAARTGAPARLVFEIGCEELPPQAAWDGARQLADGARSAFQDARIAVGEIRAVSTPRRLVLAVEDVAARQSDLVREVRGPAARAAFTADGHPTPAAEGFAKGQGVPVAALERRVTPQGEYVYAVRRERGEPTPRVLGALLPQLAGGLAFPKPMRWGTGTVRFSRPVRWLVALLGSRVVACEFAGVRAGRRTYGHRILHPTPVAVASAGAYEATLRRCFVLVDSEERRRRITDAATRAARDVDGRPILDPDLLDETVQLVEWPEAFVGHFAEEFLALPREVLITVMQHHQKYFALEDAAGRLLPAFVAVRNGNRRGLATVREGNEWVLRARLADGRFFFDEDRKRRLEDRVPALRELVFLDRLGTMADKTARLEHLARILTGLLRLSTSDGQLLGRAAHLSKADLVTQVVRELPELQGIMGGIYARLDGEPAPVADAIREQYLPRGTTLPASAIGAHLALIDKVDTLLSALAAGITPSGSQDPYGLRRAASGIVAVVLRHEIRVSLDTLARETGVIPATDEGRVLQEWRSALRQRLRAALIDEGISYDTVDAALEAGADDLIDAAARARALWEFRRTAAFASVYTAFDRAARILPKDVEGEIREDLFAAPAERALLGSLRKVQDVAHAAARPGDHAPQDGAALGVDALVRRYGTALERLAGLAGPVDRFFQDVLVMDPDEAVRRNRLALLAGVVGLIRPIADLSRVVVGEGKATASS
jgi:glycyl-tRNA synthetase beta chain